LGKVNINTVSQDDIISALADANNTSNFNDQDARDLFNNTLKSLRDPGSSSVFSPRPFSGFGEFVNNDYTLEQNANPPMGQVGKSQKTGLSRSLLAYMPFDSANPGTAEEPVNSKWNYSTFANSGKSEYGGKEILNKIFNSITTRSNVFGIWITTGYFEVTDDTTEPPRLGAEIGAADGINIRHRMFAIVDRTNLVLGKAKLYQQITASMNPQDVFVYPTISKFSNGARPGFAGNPPYQVSDNYFDFYNGVATPMRDNLAVTFDPDTDNEETVLIRGNGPFQAVFQKNHSADATVIIRGNPGPWRGYDFKKDGQVVPYVEFLE